LEFFSWFREYNTNFATHAKPLTYLTAKEVPSKNTWGIVEQKAFEQLKILICKATEQPLNIVDFNKPFNIYVDMTDNAIAGIVTQKDKEWVGPANHFASCKLSDTQRARSTIEKESYATLWSLQKYRK